MGCLCTMVGYTNKLMVLLGFENNLSYFLGWKSIWKLGYCCLQFLNWRTCIFKHPYLKPVPNGPSLIGSAKDYWGIEARDAVFLKGDSGFLAAEAYWCWSHQPLVWQLIVPPYTVQTHPAWLHYQLYCLYVSEQVELQVWKMYVMWQLGIEVSMKKIEVGKIL